MTAPRVTWPGRQLRRGGQPVPLTRRSACFTSYTPMGTILLVQYAAATTGQRDTSPRLSPVAYQAQPGSAAERPLIRSLRCSQPALDCRAEVKPGPAPAGRAVPAGLSRCSASLIVPEQAPRRGDVRGLRAYRKASRAAGGTPGQSHPVFRLRPPMTRAAAPALARRRLARPGSGAQRANGAQKASHLGGHRSTV